MKHWCSYMKTYCNERHYLVREAGTVIVPLCTRKWGGCGLASHKATAFIRCRRWLTCKYSNENNRDSYRPKCVGCVNGEWERFE